MIGHADHESSGLRGSADDINYMERSPVDEIGDLQPVRRPCGHADRTALPLGRDLRVHACPEIVYPQIHRAGAIGRERDARARAY